MYSMFICLELCIINDSKFRIYLNYSTYQNMYKDRNQKNKNIFGFYFDRNVLRYDSMLFFVNYYYNHNKLLKYKSFAV